MKRFELILTLALLAINSNLMSNTLPYLESEIILDIKNEKIVGSLVSPNDSKPSPLVIIVPGSGPTDRNGNSDLGIHTDSYKLIASGLAEHNISSFRYDKRGVGSSKMLINDGSKLTFETYIEDLIALIKHFKNDEQYTEIIVLGHSEGSLIGMIAAERTDLNGFISISGAGKTADKILLEQLQALPPELYAEAKSIISNLKDGKIVENYNPSLDAIFKLENQPYIISWLKYDPCFELAKLDVPILLIQGTTDLQTRIGEVELLSKSNPRAMPLIIKNMNHVLKEADEDYQRNIATYNNPNLPLKEGLTAGIVDYIELITK